jgi:hypothetical protein
MAELESSLPSDFREWPHFSQGEYPEMKYFISGYLLSSQGDRMAMAHSVRGTMFLQDHFSITVEDEDIAVPENFESVKSIVTLVMQKLTSKG